MSNLLEQPTDELGHDDGTQDKSVESVDAQRSDEGHTLPSAAQELVEAVEHYRMLRDPEEQDEAELRVAIDAVKELL